MSSPFSDKQLNTAIWMYNHIPAVEKARAGVLVAVTAILTLVFMFHGIVLVVGASSMSAAIARNTQELISSFDPVLLVMPKELQIQPLSVVEHPNGTADFLTEVRNPNTSWVASDVEYTFLVNDAPLTSKRAFVLPGVTWLAGFKTDTEDPIQTATITARALSWSKIKSIIDKERLASFHIPVEDAQFVAGDKKEVVDTVKSVIHNDTAFSYWNAEAVVAVYKNNRLLGIGETKIEQFQSGEKRAIETGLGILSVNEVDRIDVIPKVNIFDEKNIMKLDS